MKTGLMVLIAVFFSQLSAQVQIKKFSGDGGIFDIAELGVIVNDANGKLTVEVLLPKEHRKKEYSDVDLQQDDELMMVNGKRVKTAKDCKDIYEQLSTGEEYKMGITRNGDKFIVKFKKADPKDLPKRKIVIKDDKGQGEDVFGFPALGFILTSKGNELIIDEVLEDASSTLNVKVEKGDRITKLNGESIKSGKSFSSKYDDIKVGDKMNIEFSRKGKSFVAKFNKPQPKSRVIIKN